MLIASYLILLALVIILTRGLSRTAAGFIRLCFNLLFIVTAQVILSVHYIDLNSFYEGFGVFAESLYTTAQGLTFNGGAEWAKEILPAGLQIQLWLVMFISAVLTVETVLVAFFGKAMTRLKLKIRSLRQDRCFIITGSTAQAEILVKDIERNCHKPLIVIIPADDVIDESPLATRCLIERETYLRKLNGNKSYDIVLLPSKPYYNLGLLYELDELYTNSENIRVTVFWDNDSLRFRNIEAKQVENTDDWHLWNVDVCLLSAERLVVNMFQNNDSPIDLLKKNDGFVKREGLPYLKKPFEICVIGFTSMGQEFLLSSFENSAFETADGSESFSALVLDSDLSDKRSRFLAEAPYFEGRVSFVDISDEPYAYKNSIGERIRTLDRIIVASDDTELNIQSAILLNRYMDSVGMFGRRPETVVLLHGEYKGAVRMLSRYDNIVTIDVDRELLTYKNVIERSIDSHARMIHEQYMKSSGKTQGWNALDTFKQESNRAAVNDENNKRKLYDMCDKKDESAVMLVSRYEHARWCAFHYAHGWTLLPADELSEEEIAAGVSKREKEKRHICLVSWDKLDELPQSEPGLFKSYDTENVKEILNIK